MGLKELLKSEFTKSNFFMTHPEPRLFVTLQCGPVYLYPIWTLFWSAYHLAWIIFDMYTAATDDKDDGRYFKFLTNWGFLILVSYQWLDSAAAVYIHIFKKEFLQAGQEVMMPWFYKVIWALYNIANAVGFIIVVVYWSLIGNVLNAESINKHGMIGVCILLNVCCTAKPIRVCHFYQPVALGFIYVLFSIIYQKSGGGLIYSVLNWDKPGTAIGLTLPLVLLAIPFAHAFFFGISIARDAISKICCHGIPPTVKPYENGDVGNDDKSNGDVINGDVSKCDTPNMLTVVDLSKDQVNQSFSLHLTPKSTQKSLNVSPAPSPMQGVSPSPTPMEGLVNEGAELEP